MIARIAAEKVKQLGDQFKAVAIIGPRQSGKTTLSRSCFPDKTYVSLENPDHRQFALSDPRGFLKTYSNGAVFDEIQRAPELLSWLQQVLDEETERGKYILTGSNNFLLLEKITQTLAGRVAYIDLLPFSVAEIGEIPDALEDLNRLLFRGGYPSVQAQGIAPQDWFPAYVRTYVERDVRQIKNIENLLAFEKLLVLCAGRVGQLVNFSNLGIEAGIDYKTVQSWISLLQASYIVHLLPPYFKNFNKRIVKTPKLYFYDTGLVCYLLGIRDTAQLATHPLRGALFENFIVNELITNRFNAGKRSNLYFWRDRSGHEIDVLIDEGVKLVPVEIKSGQTITSSYFKGLQYWEKLTGISGGIVYYGGDTGQERSNGVVVKSWRDVASS